MSNTTEHVLIIGFVWPEPDSSAAGHRMLQLITLFQQQGWSITFASSAAKTEYMENLESMDVETVSIQMNSSSFDDFVEELNPTIVVFDRFVVEEQFGWRVAEQCPDAVQILDTEDLHFLRRERKKAVKENRKCTTKDLLLSTDAKREIASIYRSDLSLIISEHELNLLEDTFGINTSLLQYIPFVLDPINEADKGNWPSFDERNHFMTIGNFRHAPNMDAIQYLKEEIWPLIRKQIPDVELHIYGSYVTQQAQQMHRPEDGFFIKGRADDAKDVISSAKVMLAPLRFGAGLKGKLIEAMQCGTPSITTDIGAEGLRYNETWPGHICNDPDRFADSAVRLFNNTEEWKRAQQVGQTIINKKFADPDYEGRFISRINRIAKTLQTHRSKNFVGQMLRHHTMASTEYMGRWIEEKNSK